MPSRAACVRDWRNDIARKSVHSACTPEALIGSPQMNVEIIGRFAREAAALGEGTVCALFRRSFYLRFPGERYACVGDPALGRGPLNALVPQFEMPSAGE